MSNILVITPVPTHPPDAGNRARIKTLLEALAGAGHTIVLLHIERERGDSEAMRAVHNDRYLPIQYSSPQRPWRNRLRRWQRRLGAILKAPLGHTYTLDEWWDESATEQINAAVRAHNIDTVLANYVFFSKALVDLPPGVLKLLDTHDSFAERHKRLIAAGLEPAWYSCSPADERKGINRADVVMAIQSAEADYFKSLTTKPVITVGHLVDSPAQPLTIPDNQRLLTVGSRNTINIESTRWLATSVFPLVRAVLPHATLAVVGGVCADLDDLADSPGVSLVGRADDLGDEYRKANVVVNPMRSGTGLKIKSIEALGYGCALVTTPAGSQGLEQAVNSAMIEADEAGAMAESIIGLLQHHDQAQELGAAGHAFARSYNEQCINALNAVLKDKSAKQA